MLLPVARCHPEPKDLLAWRAGTPCWLEVSAEAPFQPFRRGTRHAAHTPVGTRSRRQHHASASRFHPHRAPRGGRHHRPAHRPSASGPEQGPAERARDQVLDADEPDLQGLPDRGQQRLDQAPADSRPHGQGRHRRRPWTGAVGPERLPQRLLDDDRERALQHRHLHQPVREEPRGPRDGTAGGTSPSATTSTATEATGPSTSPGSARRTPAPAPVPPRRPRVGATPAIRCRRCTANARKSTGARTRTPARR